MTPRVVVMVLGAMTFALVVADVTLLALARSAPLPDVYGVRGVGAIGAVVFGTIGCAIAVRQPRNVVGWIFLVTGLFAPFLDPAYATYALVERGGDFPGADWTIWLLEVALIVSTAPIATYLLLVFPNGRLPSPRWRPIAWYTVCALVVATILVAVGFTSVGREPIVARNPAALDLAIAADESSRRLAVVILLGPAAVLCGAGFVHRFRRARGVERQQLKWVAYAASILVTEMALLPISFGRKPLEIAVQLSFLAIPVTAGIAILRYRLYNIDVLIKRTLVYGSLTAMLGGVYVASVLVSQQLLRGFTGGSDISVAASTLLVVALFQPIRTRVQELVDRHFFRARYDAARTVDAFSVRLRSEVDLDSVRSDLIGVIHDTMHPAHASVWLRGGQR
jgi:hypothetical protein